MSQEEKAKKTKCQNEITQKMHSAKTTLWPTQEQRPAPFVDLRLVGYAILDSTAGKGPRFFFKKQCGEGPALFRGCVWYWFSGVQLNPTANFLHDFSYMVDRSLIALIYRMLQSDSSSEEQDISLGQPSVCSKHGPMINLRSKGLRPRRSSKS